MPRERTTKVKARSSSSDAGEAWRGSCGCELERLVNAGKLGACCKRSIDVENFEEYKREATYATLRRAESERRLAIMAPPARSGSHLPGIPGPFITRAGGRHR